MLVFVSHCSEIDALYQLSQQCPKHSIIEVRIDLLKPIKIDALNTWLKHQQQPVIFTLRRVCDGGKYPDTPKRIQLIKQLIALQPSYLDIEHDTDNALISLLKTLSPKTQLIRSYHNFNETPEDLNALLSEMQHEDISIYKISTMANNSLDALRLCAFVHAYPHHNLSAHAMGTHGLFTRILGPVIGSYFTYTCLKNQCLAPGMIDYNTLTSIYGFNQLTTSTKIAALIGDPIDNSQGHVYHNHYFQQNDSNALYIKIPCKQGQLAELLHYIKQLPFYALSVTMPLKLAIIKYCDTIDERAKAIGAINTININQQCLSATNTDAPGAIKAVAALTSINHKHVVILGAGGSARAIAYEAKQQGAKVTLMNRNINRAQVIADDFNINACCINDAKSLACDIFISTIPELAFESKPLLQYCEPLIQQQPLIMNINHACLLGPLHQLALKHHARFIDGSAMFENQARLQQHYWQICKKS